MRIAYFDCFSGISGDMTIAAFLDAGLSFKTLKSELAKLKLKGCDIKAAKVSRGAISGTKFQCVTNDNPPGRRSIKEIISLINKSCLDKNVKILATTIFENIGSAESKVHGLRKANNVHLHELGDTDSIIDVVAAAIAINELGIDEVYASKITLGRSFVNTRHGRIPVPAPATLELLKGAPVTVSDVEAELVTPTGAAILKTLAKGFGQMPQMQLSKVGYGAGTITLPDRPNMLRVLIGEAKNSFKEDRINVIETNIDDMNPQNFEYLFEKLFKEGALDVYLTTVQMKKSRIGFKLTVLAGPNDLERISSAIFRETTTIGIRYYETNRLKLDRKIVKADTGFGSVRVKLSSGPGGIFTASPEYDDCVKIARNKNIPLKAVYEEAKRLVKA